MNTKSLAKHYDRLTPHERLSLIMNAVVRGDETERNRLVQTAPQVAYRGPHHFSLAQALQNVSNLHYMELLDLAARLFQALSTARDGGNVAAKVLSDYQENANDLSSDEPVFFGLSLDLPFMIGFAFKTLLAGWRLFCEKLQIPADALWEPLPGYATIRLAEILAESLAYSKEGAVAFLRHYSISGAEIQVRVIDAEHVTAGLERCLQEMLRTLGG